MEQQNRQYQSNNHRSHHRNRGGPFVDSTSSSINHRSYHHNHNQRQQSRRRNPSSCTVSICYSYLIAIFSSFLVVLGIYLALTKFNARFLYISLTGLLIEALGACIFCVSSIRKSRLAQYKQTTDDPSLENEIIANRRHQARAVTHLLTSGTLNNQTAIQISNDDNIEQPNAATRPPIENSSLLTKTQNQPINTRLQTPDLPQPRVESSDIEPSNCQDLPENDQPVPSQEQTTIQDELPSLDTGDSTIQANNDGPQNTQVQCDRNQPEDESQASTTINHPNTDKLQSSAIDEPDLTSAQPPTSPSLSPLPSQPPTQAAVTAKRNTRPANIRRTLVMGLSGEEEMIEIDEQDLDEMSILPPSYESLATDSKQQK